MIKIQLQAVVAGTPLDQVLDEVASLELYQERSSLRAVDLYFPRKRKAVQGPRLAKRQRRGPQDTQQQQQEGQRLEGQPLQQQQEGQQQQQTEQPQQEHAGLGDMRVPTQIRHPGLGLWV